jgi:hypothetical protein
MSVCPLCGGLNEQRRLPPPNNDLVQCGYCDGLYRDEQKKPDYETCNCVGCM